MTKKTIKKQGQNLINVSEIVNLRYFEFETSFIFKKEIHNFWELIYVDKGSWEINTDIEKLILNQGECYFHQPGESHMHRANGKTPPNIFIISFSCNSKAMDFFKNKKIYIPLNLRMFITNIIEEGKKTYKLPFNEPELKKLALLDETILGGQQMIKTYLEQFLILILRYEKSIPVTSVFPSAELKGKHIATQMKTYSITVYINN